MAGNPCYEPPCEDAPAAPEDAPAPQPVLLQGDPCDLVPCEADDQCPSSRCCDIEANECGEGIGWCCLDIDPCAGDLCTTDEECQSEDYPDDRCHKIGTCPDGKGWCS